MKSLFDNPCEFIDYLIGAATNTAFVMFVL